MPPAEGLGFLHFLGIYIAAYMAGLAANVPGGIGVFDGAILFALAGFMPTPGVVGALLLFRLFYYIIPLFMAGALFAGFEVSQRRKLVGRLAPDRGIAVSFEVPALAGLGAPHWDDHATGTVTGMTHATTPAHLARATFDAICHQIADVLTAMEADIAAPLTTLSADGGASANPFLMQLQADVLNVPIYVVHVSCAEAAEATSGIPAAVFGLILNGRARWS